jgi:hypothetical protein
VIIAAARTIWSTCQLYQWTNESLGRFIANGCAIFFHHNSSFYCFSCAHVLADMHLGKTFFLMKDGTSITVGGDIFFSEPISSEKRADDFLDFAVVKLNEPVYKYLIMNGHEFLDISRIHAGKYLDNADVLLISAFPATKTKIDQKTMALEFNPLVLLTTPYQGKLKEENFNRGFHHVVNYQINSLRETSTKLPTRGPKPYGISGSGLWLFAKDQEILPVPILVGILSEYHENRAVFISTKIDIFLDLIRQQFDPSLRHDGIELDIKFPDR